MKISFCVCLVFGTLAVGESAFAGEPTRNYTTGDLTVSGSVGYLTGLAHEYVYNPDGSKLSELIWDMRGNVSLNGEADLRLSNRLEMFGSFSIGLDGNNKMDDYDWLIAPYQDWSDHSVSNDTRLDHYLSIDAGLNYAALQAESWKLMAIGGFKYTDVKWTAYGGDYVYSSDPGFRDLTGSFPNTKGISYQLKLPAVYAGLGTEHHLDKLTLGFSAIAGISFDGSDEDNHWMRTPPLTFIEDFGMAPYAGLKARAEYAITDQASLIVMGNYDSYFTVKGNTTIFENAIPVGYFGDEAAGAKLETINLSVGLNYGF